MARETGATLEEVEAWAKADRWDIRNELYDRWIAEVLDRSQEDAISEVAKESGRRAAEIYRHTNEILVREVTRLNVRSKQIPFHGNVEGPIKVGELKTLIELQEHFPRSEEGANVDFAKLSDEELLAALEAKETYERLRRKAQGK